VFLSAAQSQPNARGVKTALVAGMPLCRAALNTATSSPSAQMKLESAAEQFGRRNLEESANSLNCCADLPVW
jgi:hypothetical protein